MKKTLSIVLVIFMLISTLCSCDMQGEQGIQGEQGAVGEQGVQGAQGEQGEKGNDERKHTQKKWGKGEAVTAKSFESFFEIPHCGNWEEDPGETSCHH